MQTHKNKILCLMFLSLFCLTLDSCKISGNIFQSYSEVDFATPQKVQVLFDERIYDTTVVLNNSKLEVNFNDENDLLDGAYVCLSADSYRITYRDMVFAGEKTSLTSSFMPCIIYNFIFSFEDKIILNAYDKQRDCYYIKKSVNGYFVSLECYLKDGRNFYSMEIK